jgi:uncharacterized membrane protein YeaQ/YmgE (transglycosylase-associated protein family)
VVSLSFVLEVGLLSIVLSVSMSTSVVSSSAPMPPPQSLIPQDTHPGNSANSNNTSTIRDDQQQQQQQPLQQQLDQDAQGGSLMGRLIGTIGSAIMALSQMHLSARESDSSIQAIVTLLHSTIAAIILCCVFLVQLFSVALNLDSFLVRMHNSMESTFSNVTQQLRRNGSITTFWPPYVKSLMKMVWLIMAYKFKFADIKLVFMDLTTIRVILEWITFAVDHRDDPAFASGEQRLHKLRLIFCYVIGVAIIGVLYYSYSLNTQERFNNMEHFLILTVWLGEPVFGLAGSISMLAYSISVESLHGSMTTLRLDISLSVCYCVITILMYLSGHFQSTYWAGWLFFHYFIPIVISTSRLVQLHGIQWQMQTRFKQLTKTEVENLAADDMCRICLHSHEYPSTLRLSCGHLAHSGCLINMLKSSVEPKCPLCRASIPLQYNSDMTGGAAAPRIGTSRTGVAISGRSTSAHGVSNATGTNGRVVSNVPRTSQAQALNNLNILAQSLSQSGASSHTQRNSSHGFEGDGFSGDSFSDPLFAHYGQRVLNRGNINVGGRLIGRTGSNSNGGIGLGLTSRSVGGQDRMGGEFSAQVTFSTSSAGPVLDSIRMALTSPSTTSRTAAASLSSFSPATSFSASMGSFSPHTVPSPPVHTAPVVVSPSSTTVAETTAAMPATPAVHVARQDENLRIDAMVVDTETEDDDVCMRIGPMGRLKDIRKPSSSASKTTPVRTRRVASKRKVGVSTQQSQSQAQAADDVIVDDAEKPEVMVEQLTRSTRRPTKKQRV